LVDAAQVRKIKQAGAIIRHHEVDGRLIVLREYRLSPQPLRKLQPTALKEEIRRNPIRITLQRKRPVGKVGRISSATAS